ncbi:hypothetical protein [Leisingera methylohalidivorans]|uniref:Uncharacterized protein n=1 Tax=Leisingera methylohalidivorans DSM 14336 TaxID=999552 RepID=V9VZ48_9RHOB|nr:hypothetical protein [Leisingera methylohalidivorans]AHD03049.1 hypothetical protein METH_09635 [Leisingera methylohalidivorans DSM 14336]
MLIFGEKQIRDAEAIASESTTLAPVTSPALPEDVWTLRPGTLPAAHKRGGQGQDVSLSLQDRPDAVELLKRASSRWRSILLRLRIAKATFPEPDIQKVVAAAVDTVFCTGDSEAQNAGIQIARFFPLAAFCVCCLWSGGRSLIRVLGLTRERNCQL